MWGPMWLFRSMRLAVLLTLGLLACSPAPACPTEGTGTVTFTFSGLPAGVSGKVSIVGASTQAVTADQPLTLAAGQWQVRSELVTVDDAIVRAAFEAKPSLSDFCVAKGKTIAVDVPWTKVGSSSRLWFANDSGGTQTLHGFDSGAIATSATVPSSWSGAPQVAKAMAFDKTGTLWAAGNTSTDPMLATIKPAQLATSGTPELDRRFTLAIPCVPAIAFLALDKDGNVYVGSACDKKVFRLAAESLGASPLTPSLELKGFSSVSGLALDKDGNLWVSDGAAHEVLRFDAASLTGASATPSRRVLVKRTDLPADTSTLEPAALAFDKDGNLWSYDFGLNLFFAVPAAELAGTGQRTTNPLVRVTVSVQAVLAGLAFDEGGGLWFPYRAGTFARLSPSQLTVSTGAGAPTVPDTIVTGSSLGSVKAPAFFPGAKGTPLASALP